jgi:hypothetical protein
MRAAHDGPLRVNAGAELTLGQALLLLRGKVGNLCYATLRRRLVTAGARR